MLRSTETGQRASKNRAWDFKESCHLGRTTRRITAEQAALVSNSPQTGCLAAIRRNLRNLTSSAENTENKMFEMHKNVKTAGLVTMASIAEVTPKCALHLWRQGDPVPLVPETQG